MSLDLKDLRAKITPESWAFLQGRAEAEGKDVSEVVRDVLHSWALREVTAFKVANRYLRAEGLPAADSGAGGKGP